MKSFNEVINEKKSLKKKWLETPDYTAKRMRTDYQYKFYGTEHEITNEILYMMLIDVMDKLDRIEKYIMSETDDNDIIDKLDRIENNLSDDDDILDKLDKIE